jgi:hypothetical protein
VEDLRAVRVHRGRGLADVQPARIDLADVGDEFGLGAARVPEQLGEPAEELVVGDRVQLVGALHTDNISSIFAKFLEPLQRAAARKVVRAPASCPDCAALASLANAQGISRTKEASSARSVPKLVKGK